MYGVLNIICNIFYALFSALSFIALIPMLDVLFKKEQDCLGDKEILFSIKLTNT